MAVREELAALMRDATKNRSQRRIARDADVSQTTIGNMLLGRVPGQDICRRVAAAAGIDEETMLRAAGHLEPADPVDRVKLCLRAPRMLPETERQLRQVIEQIEAERAKNRDNESQ